MVFLLALASACLRCSACQCPELVLDEDCVRASVSVGGLGWEQGVSLTLLLDGQPVAVLECLDLPDPDATAACTANGAPHEIDAQIHATSAPNVGYLVSAEIVLIGLNSTPTELHMDVVLPDDTQISTTALFDEVDIITDPNPTSETCPDRRCLVAPLFAGWDDPSIGDGTTTGG